MIIGNINDRCHLTLNEDLHTALEWIAQHHGDQFTKGTIEIIPTRIKVNYEEVGMVAREKQLLEAHRRYADIHVPISGEETIGWSPICDLKNRIHAYDSERDIEFYGDAPQCYIPILPGQYVILFPEDAHAPCIGTGIHRKLCVKIALD
ncbi:MAG: YhcH/YjgK/YiaL family protein [Muribaculaceae bacterium]|nr:YhcH/YjgK/YiaL family protein [Muribaculaceae bacterium]